MMPAEPRTLRVYRALLRAFPANFRKRFETDLVELFTDLHDAAPSPRLGFWARIVWATLSQGLAERVTARRAPRDRCRWPKDPLMLTVLQDVHLALRSFYARPGFAITVVLTMAFGIGVTSAMFTVVNAVLLRPLPYDQPARVVMLFERDPKGQSAQVSLVAAEDWRAQLTTMSRIAVFGSQTANLTGRGEPDRMRAGFVSAEFFEVLGVTPVIGRGFAPGEDRPGATGVAVLPHGVWAQRFGSDPAIVGRTLMLNNQPFEVIGVLPRRFEFPFDEIEVFLPYTATPGLPPRARDRRAMFVFGRLADAASLEAANAELLRVTAGTAAAFPDTNTGWSGEVVPFQEVAVRLVRTPLYILMAAVGLVLLVACVNVANLTLARASARGQEMAVRAALGASRARLVAQLLTESVTLALAGGLLGLLLGGILTEALLSLAPPLPRRATIGPDPIVLGFTAAISILTGLAFGILPALRASRGQVAEGLHHATRVTDAGGRRLKGALVVAELALSLTLLVCAGLLAKSLARMVGTDPGFVPDRVLTMEYRLPRNKYTTADAQWDVHRRIAASVAEVPGIERAALASAVPFSGNGGRMAIWRAEDPEPDPGTAPTALATLVTDGYFDAMRIPVLAGRSCGQSDRPDSPLVVTVNRLLADRLWPGGTAVGQRLRAAGMPGDALVIGVVGNTLHQGQRAGLGAQLYACFAQSPGLFATVVARTMGEPMQSARAVQQAVWVIDPEQSVWKIRSMTTLVASGVDRERLVTTLMVAAALLALALAALGVYSVISHSVAQRSREVAVRMALGASRATILRLVLRETGTLIVLGLGVGLLSALGAGRAIASQLVGVAPGDPFTLAATGLLLAVAAIAAALLPAARASSVDPVANLRE